MSWCFYVSIALYVIGWLPMLVVTREYAVPVWHSSYKLPLTIACTLLWPAIVPVTFAWGFLGGWGE